MTGALAALDKRPAPGALRAYDFPDFDRVALDNGLTILLVHVPGRPLLQAQLIVRGDTGGGATSEAPEHAGVSALMSRAMSEGTTRRDAIQFIEAAERLGAELGAGASWDSLGVHVEVARTRLDQALTLLAELSLQPSFPEHEVERLRHERLNDLRQAKADPRRRAERAFSRTIYAPGATYARSLGGDEQTVAGLDRDVVAERHAQLMRPAASTLIVSGDLADVPVREHIERAFGDWHADQAEATSVGPLADAPASARRVVVVDRPGAPQSEIRVGHVGTRRQIDDFHAVAVMNALLGGLFNSRLNRLLREERGYTYGVNSSFDMRRAAGPFAVRCAVESDVTTASIVDIMSELERLRDAPVETQELDAARDYLVGVFPLRFETSAQVAGALAGLVTFGLPDDELDRYRPTIASVDAAAVHAAANQHIRPDAASIVVVGDAARFADQLGEAGFGECELISDDDIDA